MTISLQSSAGSKNTSAIVGMVLFCQFWYWYPLAHCACLAFNPTAIIGVNDELLVRVLLMILKFVALMILTDPQIRVRLECQTVVVCLPKFD